MRRSLNSTRRNMSSEFSSTHSEGIMLMVASLRNTESLDVYLSNSTLSCLVSMSLFLKN